MNQIDLREIEIDGKSYIKLDEFDLWLEKTSEMLLSINKEKWDLISQLEELRKEYVRYKRLMRRQIKRWKNEHCIVLEKGYDI